MKHIYHLFTVLLISSFLDVSATPKKQWDGDIKKVQSVLNEKMNERPSVFTKNRGQWESEVLFRTQYENTNINFTSQGLSFGLRKSHDNLPKTDADRSAVNMVMEPVKFEYLVWDLNYINHNLEATWEVDGEVKSKVNYFKGADGDHPVLGTYDYNTLTHKGVYNNINVDYYLQDNKLKYDYIVKPGGKVGDIKLQFDGIENLRLDANGELVIETKWGEFRKSIPYSYQVIDGMEVEVKVEFYLLGSPNGYGMRVVGDYNKEVDLVIDPVYIDWGSYFYGTGQGQQSFSYSYIYDVDVDEDDYVYLCGWTTDKFPTDPGWYDTSINGTYDGFLCKMKFDGSDIEWFNYIGGTNTEWFFSLTVTPDGRVYGTGRTTSTDFPTTKGAMQESYMNTGTYFYPAFVFGMNTQGTKLIYSSYLDFGNYQYGYYWNGQPITVNDKGEVYVGLSYRKGSNINIKNYILPAAYYNTVATGNLALILKINSSGSDILKSTLHGGSGEDYVYGLYLDKDENIFAVGSTTSANLYVTSGVAGFGKRYLGNGNPDGWMVKIDSAFSKYLVAKYLGGTGYDVIYGVHGSEDGIYMLLQTTSPNLLGVNNTGGGQYDVAVAKIWPDGLKADYVTFIGGNSYEYPRGITANIREEVIIVGQTYSNDFPTTPDALKTSSSSNYTYGYNGFLTKLDYYGKILYSTYIGGSGYEWLWGVSTKRIGCVTHIVVAGYSSSTDFPVTKGSWRDTARKVQNGYWWYGGAILKMRDTLRLSKIDLGGEYITCNNIYKVLDAGNFGAGYTWSTGDTTRRIFVEDTGTYWVQATYGCGTESDTMKVVLKHSPKKINLQDSIYCGIISDTLDAKNDTIPDVTYTWNTGDESQKLVVQDTGTYSVKIATKYCGTLQESVHLSLLQLPKITLPKDTLICSEINLDLEAKNNNKEIKYSWNTGDTVKTITATDTGYYKVNTSNYCGVDSADIYIKRDTAPRFAIQEDSIFCDTVALSISPGAYSSYTNLTHSGNFTDSTKGMDGVWSYQISREGSYWLQLENGCGIHREDIAIGKLVSPTVTLKEADTMCDFVFGYLNVGTPNNQESYEWMPGSIKSDNITVDKPGTYSVMVKNKCGEARDTTTIVQINTPKVDLGLDSVFCETVSHVLTVGTPGNDETYEWSTNESGTTVNVNKEGVYSVTATNYCGATSDTVEYTILLSPTVNLGEDRVFCGTVVPDQSLDAGNEGRNEKYLWSTGDTTQIITTNQPGNISVIVSNKCASSTDDLDLILSDYPVVDLGLDTNFCGDFNFTLDAGNSGSRFAWSPSGANQQVVTLTDYGVHEVTVTNQYGCESKDEIEITQNCSTLYFLPNAFTPNANGRNEVFKPVVNDIFEYEFTIYNRWGEILFKTTDTDEGWDGTFMGKPVMQGMYLWTISYKGVDRWEHKNGTVFLKK